MSASDDDNNYHASSFHGESSRAPQQYSGYYHHHQQQQPQQQSSYKSSSNLYRQNQQHRQFAEDDAASPLMKKSLEWMEYLTRPKMAVLVAVVVIVYFQFQSTIHAWLDFYFPPHVSLYESLTAIFWQMADWIRGNFQRARSLVLGQGGGSSSSNNQASVAGFAAGPSNNTLYPGGGGGNFQSNNTFSSQLPELEEPVQSLYRSGAPIQEPQQQPLPPAFLEECDYPKGWMVYHRELGVVLKTEADQYNEENDDEDETGEQQPVPTGHDEEEGCVSEMDTRSGKGDGQQQSDSMDRTTACSSNNSNEDGSNPILYSLSSTDDQTTTTAASTTVSPVATSCATASTRDSTAEADLLQHTSAEADSGRKSPLLSNATAPLPSIAANG